MNNKNKDFVFTDYLEMIKKSWTYARMTQEENEEESDAFYEFIINNLDWEVL